MGTTTQSFNYSGWSVTKDTDYGSYICVKSSGTTPSRSTNFDINKVVSVSCSVTGGWGWIATYVNGQSNIAGNSLYVNITVTIYLVKSDGSRTKVTSATGSAGTGGDLNQYDHSTTSSCSYTIKDSDKQNYKYVQIEYTISHSRSEVGLTPVNDGCFRDGSAKNPSGSSTITLRNNIPVNYKTTSNSTELEALKYNNGTTVTNITSLKYNNTTIY